MFKIEKWYWLDAATDEMCASFRVIDEAKHVVGVYEDYTSAERAIDRLLREE